MNDQAENPQNPMEPSATEGSGQLSTHQASSEFVEFAQVMQGITQPIADAQETAAKEATERAKVTASTVRILIIGAYVVGALIIGLAAYALALGDSDMAEKVIVALLAFLGGFGLGKGANSAQA
ncbi:hypothetical protein NYO91_00765 [Arhodomonas aquaeolei]|uniref:hypothetical protein n=1 Tax=Arhodomonas aquaeolei TaxID=2369 RepID=UPI002167B7A9|nr:hypothetical protein [Arhodomonas aquaeolei]MCS4502599.1 hypothetical protein [Arhodomonas aquaeolei]